MDPTSLYRALERLAAAAHPPVAPQDSGQPPWHDEAFSERMLAIHLDDTTHMASRAGWVIRAHVDWLEEQLRTHDRRPIRSSIDASARAEEPAGGWRVLDVTCGPGLYCHELARRGWPTVGVDVAPAPLRFARETATRENLACSFLREDVTALPDDLAARLGPLAAVTFWFGEFHALPRAAAAPLLARLAALLEPGGLFVLEYQPWDSFPQEDGTEWQVASRSPFHDGLQLWLQEWSWDAAKRAMVDVHWILAAEDGRLERFVQCHRAYGDDELHALLASAGLTPFSHHPPLTGCDPAFEFPVLVAVRHPEVAGT